MESRKTLTLTRSLSDETLIKIRVKRSPEEIKKKIEQDKIQRVKRVKAALIWLVDQYPDCFNQKNPKPLKLKIEADIFQELTIRLNEGPDLQDIPSKKSIRDALSYYTHSIKYLKAHMNYDSRIDLKGNELSEFPVSEADKVYSIEMINHIKSTRSN